MSHLGVVDRIVVRHSTARYSVIAARRNERPPISPRRACVQ
jgi:hypothetical protein